MENASLRRWTGLGARFLSRQLMRALPCLETPLERPARAPMLLMYLTQLLRSCAHAELTEEVLRMDVRLGEVNTLRVEGG